LRPGSSFFPEKKKEKKGNFVKAENLRLKGKTMFGKRRLAHKRETTRTIVEKDHRRGSQKARIEPPGVGKKAQRGEEGIVDLGGKKRRAGKKRTTSERLEVRGNATKKMPLGVGRRRNEEKRIRVPGKKAPSAPIIGKKEKKGEQIFPGKK